MQFDVNIPSASYPVFIEAGCGRRIQAHLSATKATSVFALIDENVQAVHADYLNEYLPSDCVRFVIPAGEATKSLQQLSDLYDKVLGGRELDRASVILAVGGGVVGDLAGFLAATLMRGIRCVQVPTTLLAMVDSSVGGKTAINHTSGKNLIGAFHQPTAVFADTAFLKTLPKREYISGFAEIIKTAVIGDADLFAFLQENSAELLTQDDAALKEILAACVRFKATVVAEDERESGRRAILNYGHTVGHVLESAFSGKYLHGEAVAIGMVAANHLAVASRTMPQTEAATIKNLISQFTLPTELPSELTAVALEQGIRSDKKRAADSVNFVLPTNIGDVKVSLVDINTTLINTLLGQLNA
ncbi:3-dehydroquinate synthase [Planctomycetota bacterium]|nr:3-dehydroquinate synthase [Planctomycetota bacterium]